MIHLQKGIRHETSIFIRIGVIHLQEGIRHGALVFIRIEIHLEEGIRLGSAVFIRIGVMNLHERIRHGTTVFFTYIYLHIDRTIGYIVDYTLYKLICPWCGLFDFRLALKQKHAAKHPCRYENLWSVPVSEICVIKDWLHDLSDFN